MPADARQGTARRRIHSNSPCDLLVGVQKPANLRLLIARFRASAVPASYDLPEFRSLELRVQEETEGGSAWLSITLCAPQPALNDIFTSLAEDVARAVGKQAEETSAAITFQRRLLQWQKLLQRTGDAGLTAEEQQGLYGELWCLREIVLPALPYADALRAWTGPEAAAKDFQFAGGIAAEVKTTQAREPEMLTIASERQLDSANLNALYVLHLSIEILRGAGETLPEIVASLLSLTVADPMARILLEERLLAAGYADLHAARYAERGYTRRNIHCYAVKENFPRLIVSDLRHGVGNTRYTILAAACAPFAVDISQFTIRLGGQP